jgi:uncharacterized repeat protein (TIGR03803 family)
MSDTHFALKHFRSKLILLAAILGLLVAAAQPAQAQTESVLYRFCSLPDCADGIGPSPNLILDAQGNLYGTAGSGSSDCCGVVFEITKTGAETVIGDIGGVGESPNGGLIRDASGNFYGTTTMGGYDKPPCAGVGGCGAIFEMTPTGTATALYTYTGYEGHHPNGGLIIDTLGNLYGTTYAGAGGYKEPGFVFKLTPTGALTSLHDFKAYKGDGQFPSAGLVMDGEGNLYGTTSAGGHGGDIGPGKVICSRGCGTVFEVSAAGAETTLYTFKGFGKKDGALPLAGLIRDASGNLYGTTWGGGAYGYGTVFQVTATGGETVLLSFTGTADGSNPEGSLIMDAQGNLYGTTDGGGAYGYGTVFEVTAPGKEIVLYSFTGGEDGAYPADGLVSDEHGNLYGTTYNGGNFSSPCPRSTAGCGVVFKVTP